MCQDQDSQKETCLQVVQEVQIYNLIINKSKEHEWNTFGKMFQLGLDPLLSL